VEVVHGGRLLLRKKDNQWKSICRSNYQRGFFKKSKQDNLSHMTYQFQLSDFPGSTFEMQTSIWTGKSKLFKDGERVNQSTEKGKPFLIPSAVGGVVKAFPKQTYPDFVPLLEILGTKHLVVAKLPWYEYVIGGIPVVLLFIGGGLGGLLGGLGMVTNYHLFRENASPLTRYAKVMALTVGCFILYFAVALVIATFIPPK
jgi:hypothetical protein